MDKANEQRLADVVAAYDYGWREMFTVPCWSCGAQMEASRRTTWIRDPLTQQWRDPFKGLCKRCLIQHPHTAQLSEST